MMEELIARVFATRNAAHLAHLATRSYAQHMALGDFYEGLIEKIDNIAETYQGAFGLIKEVELIEVDKKEITEHLSDEAKWINANREKLSGDICAIENLIDDLVDSYLRTYYKLKKLS